MYNGKVKEERERSLTKLLQIKIMKIIKMKAPRYRSSRSQIFMKKKLQHRCFPLNFAKFSSAALFIEHLRWLLLKIEPRDIPVKTLFIC